MENFLKIMNEKFYPYLGKRENTFKIMFNYLNSLNKDKYLIVETGTTRYNDNITGDGMSTVMFDTFCNTDKNGLVYTVDIDPSACALVRSMTSLKTVVCINDSVKFLASFPNPEDIDLLYLDSFDLDWDNPHLSSLHHLKELAAVYAKLKPGCLIVVDDNNNGVGKGQYVSDFLNNSNDSSLLFDDYQIGYIKL